ncbi:hypothetical protein [Cyanobium sp. NIES-981]|uniref:GT-D fold domain-containing protein n=1 Tax=Cyanobium sp. NIES-981 TaxID=1851505 RepID=UPI00155FD399|nr:hypothetical protein [Cyanobium sp. NIES-981]
MESSPALPTINAYTWADHFSFDGLLSLGRSHLRKGDRASLFLAAEAALRTGDAGLASEVLQGLEMVGRGADPSCFQHIYHLALADLLGQDLAATGAVEPLLGCLSQLPLASSRLALRLLSRAGRAEAARPALEQAGHAPALYLNELADRPQAASRQLRAVLPELDADAAHLIAGFLALVPESLRQPGHEWWDPTAADPHRLTQLQERLRQALRSRQGFALIRLGDGEGLFLSGLRNDLGGATTNGTPIDPRLTPQGHLLPEEYARLMASLCGAVERADVVGLPDLDQIAHGPRQMGTVLSGLGQHLTLARLVAMRQRFVSGGAHLHLFLLHAGALLQPDLLEALHGVVGPVIPPGLEALAPGSYVVPGEKRYWTTQPGGRPPHYPHYFERFAAWADTHVRPGRLFLVGAGILGKIYCDRIRERGGVALDLGSVLDLLVERYDTRGEIRRSPHLKRAADRFLAAFAERRGGEG